MSVQSININSRAFATQKAIQMMEELRSIVETQNINVLDNYNDGSKYQYLLTTQLGITDPGNRMSGNVKIAGQWKYARQIAIIPMPNDSFSRQVFVRVYRNTSADPNTPAPAETLAETSAILKTIVSNYVPSQCLDVYIIALENVPGWWSSLATMRPMFSDVIQDMQMRNPGLIINSHWITRSAYGRDQRYTPYINSTLHTNDAVGAVPRLINLGVKAVSVGPALSLVIAQRLVRVLCKDCKKKTEPDAALAAKIKNFLNRLPAKVDKKEYQAYEMYGAVGCPRCSGLGYKGRIGIFEFLEGGPDLEKTILKEASEVALREVAQKQEMVTMQQDGILKVLQGKTTLSEVESVTGEVEW